MDKARAERFKASFGTSRSIPVSPSKIDKISAGVRRIQIGLTAVILLCAAGVAMSGSQLAQSDGRGHRDLDDYDARAHIFESRDEKAKRATLPRVMRDLMRDVQILEDTAASSDPQTAAMARAMLEQARAQADEALKR